MRQNDLLKSDAGDHLRVLLYGEQQSYVVNCQRCKMPFPISTSSLLLMEKLPQDMYRLLALDEDISERQRQQRDRRAELIRPLWSRNVSATNPIATRSCARLSPAIPFPVKPSCNIYGYTGSTSPKMRYCLPKNPTPRNVLCRRMKRPSAGRSTNFITLHKSRACRPPIR